MTAGARIASMISLSALMLVAALAASPPQPPRDPAPALQQQVRVLLNDYSQKDVPGILAMLGAGPVLFMGTDVSEVASSRAAIQQLLDNDFKGWTTSRFGPFKNFFVRSSGDMATALFDVPWTATMNGQNHTFTIRLATVWQNTAQGWRLVQALNAVATDGGR